MVALVNFLVANDRNPIQVSSNGKELWLLSVTAGFGKLKHNLQGLMFSYSQRLYLYIRKVSPTNKEKNLREDSNWPSLVTMPISEPITVPREMNDQIWPPVGK